MIERITVLPRPSECDVEELTAGLPEVRVRIEYGRDARGRERAVVTLEHASPDLVAVARERWLERLRSAGCRAFVV